MLRFASVSFLTSATLLCLTLGTAYADLAEKRAGIVQQLCTSMGESINDKVALRDLGVPPSQQLQELDNIRRQRNVRADTDLMRFEHWAILVVYDMAMRDATWIRQHVETKCFQTFH